MRPAVPLSTSNESNTRGLGEKRTPSAALACGRCGWTNCQREKFAGVASGGDAGHADLQGRLAVTLVSAVSLPALELDAGDFVSLELLQDFSLHRSAFHVGETNGGLALAGGNQEDAIKNDLASRFCSFTEVCLLYTSDAADVS